MKNSFNQANQLVTINKDKLVLGEQNCKISISGYLLYHYKIFNPEGYTIMCRLREASDGLNYSPRTSKIVLDSGQQIKLMYNFEQFVPNVVEDLEISQQAALKKSDKFFANTRFIVQPTGI